MEKIISFYHCQTCNRYMTNVNQKAIEAHRILEHPFQPKEVVPDSIPKKKRAKFLKKEISKQKEKIKESLSLDVSFFVKRIEELETKIRLQKEQIKTLEATTKEKTFNFYESREWRMLRRKVRLSYPKKCMCCNATDVRLDVDHIKPRHQFPELELDFDNLQILCEDCNKDKSDRDSVDHRNPATNA